MALMLPDIVHPDVKSRAERFIFALLASSGGSSKWVCLHSLGLGRHVSQRAGEIDFVLITERGILVLEVKGGGVSRRQGEWVFVDRFGNARTDRRGPFEQARAAAYTLEHRIRERFGAGSGLGRAIFAYAVVAPDCRLREEIRQHEGTELAELVYDFEDRGRRFEAFVDRVLQTTQQRYKDAGRHFGAIKASEVEAIVDFLRGDFDAVVPLSVHVDESVRALTVLQRGQYAVLDAMRESPRCVVEGAAGTGKTLLAAEATMRASLDGKRVLHLCFNRLLAKHLQARLRNVAARGFVGTVHSYLHHVIQVSPLAAEFDDRCRREHTAEAKLSLYPTYGAMALLEGNPEPFDLLVCDEAQDFLQQGVFDVLDLSLLGGLEAGSWRVFLDANNQAAVFGKCDSDAIDRLRAFGRSLLLSVNCRNTRQIVHETTLLTEPRHVASSLVDGAPVEYLWVESNADVRAAVQGVLDRLSSTESVASGRITVLSARQLGEGVVSELRCRGRSLEPLTDDNVSRVQAGEFPAATCCTVSAFKGLENDFIVLLDIDDFDSPWWKAVSYVGMTRARAKLYIVLPKALRRTHDQKVESWLEQHAVRSSEGGSIDVAAGATSKPAG